MTRCVLFKRKTDFVDIHPFKSCLKNFEVVYIFMLQLCLKFDLLQKDATWKQHVHELAICRSWKTQNHRRYIFFQASVKFPFAFLPEQSCSIFV